MGVEASLTVDETVLVVVGVKTLVTEGEMINGVGNWTTSVERTFETIGPHPTTDNDKIRNMAIKEMDFIIDPFQF